MILYKGNSILAIVATLIITADERPVAIVLLVQIRPVLTVGRIAENILKLEIESTAGLFGFVNPFADFALTVPVFAYGELWLTVFVIQFGVAGTIALHHVVAEACIAEIFQ